MLDQSCGLATVIELDATGLHVGRQATPGLGEAHPARVTAVHTAAWVGEGVAERVGLLLTHGGAP